MANGKTLEQEILDKYNGDIKAIITKLEEVSRVSRKQKKAIDVSGDVVIALDAVSKKYKVGKQSINALQNISLNIHQGEFVALTGPSGSGKSTLLQLIGALDKASSGVVRVNNQDVAKLSDRKLSTFRNQTIGFVFQFFYLQPFLNVQRNLEVPGMFARVTHNERKNRAKSFAESVGLSDRLGHLPNELSGGQMQRAAIARALLNSPKIILADEPTGNLDRENAFAIMDLFDEVREKFGATVIVVTHDSELAGRADREIKLQDGAVVQS